MLKLETDQILSSNHGTVRLASFFLLWLLLVLAPLLAQRTTKIDPKDPFLVTIPETGRMHGILNNGAVEENFGTEVHAIGKVDDSGVAGFLVVHSRIDTVVPHLHPNELLLYHGVRGGLPRVQDGQRIGPTDILSLSRFLTTGDFNGDGYQDIIISYSLYNDTVNVTGTNYGYVVIFWGGTSGYSISDTSRLSCGDQYWAGPNTASVFRRTGSGVDDIAILGLIGRSQGVNHEKPQLVMWQGHKGEKFGRNGIPSQYTWSWYAPPTCNRISCVEQDCDNAPDLTLNQYEGDGAVNSIGRVTVLYGDPNGQMPDTINFESVDLASVNGYSAILSDISGDGVPEMLVITNDEYMKVYAGKPGKRIREQFGSGADGPDPAHGRPYPRPWASFPLPYQLDNVFYPCAGELRLAFGDAGIGGTNDIWVGCGPWIFGYSSGANGECLDSLFDSILYAIGMVENLGDIDGSGVNTLGSGSDRFDDFVQFFKPVTALNDTNVDCIDWRIPMNPPGNACGTRAGVELMPIGKSDAVPLTVVAVPDLGNGQIAIRWSHGIQSGVANIAVTSTAGGNVRTAATEASRGEYMLEVSELPTGKYFVSVRVGSELAVTEVLITK